MGLQSRKPHRSIPSISPFFVCYGGITKGTGAAIINRVMLGRAGFKGQNAHSFSGQICPQEVFVLVQGCSCLWHCFQAESGMGNKATKRLGDFLQKEWGIRLWQSQGVRVSLLLLCRPLSPSLMALHYCACLRLPLPWGVLPIIG